MAIGLGLMLGFVFPKNFDSPYRSQSITEFWHRWHISLSAWLRDYLYVPLGGNRKGRVRTYVNLFLVMLLGGLWHGAAWNFVIWGALHGVLLAVERFAERRRSTAACPRPCVSAMTFTLVLITWVFFRARDLPHAFSYLGDMFALGDPAGRAPAAGRDRLSAVLPGDISAGRRDRLERAADVGLDATLTLPKAAAVLAVCSCCRWSCWPRRPTTRSSISFSDDDTQQPLPAGGPTRGDRAHRGRAHRPSPRPLRRVAAGIFPDGDRRRADRRVVRHAIARRATRSSRHRLVPPDPTFPARSARSLPAPRQGDGRVENASLANRDCRSPG